MLNNQEIRILYHIIDNLYPDIEKKQSGRFELKPENYREYLDNISFSESDFKALCELKQKIQAEMTGFFLKRASND